MIVDAIHDDERGLIGFAKITRDITEKRAADALIEQTRAALFQSQKMDAVGKLTGGVAHDFNNVLQVLRGNLELLQLRCRQDDWFTERLLAALDAVDRGARLASHLLAFARRQALQPVATNLYAMVLPAAARPRRKYQDNRRVTNTTYVTQESPIEAAKSMGHKPLVARVRATDKGNPDHWRTA